MVTLPLRSPTSPLDSPPKLTHSQLLLPTSVLYAAPVSSTPPIHSGPYAAERSKLDWSYHKVPSPERAALQDAIVERVLRQRGCGGRDREVGDCEAEDRHRPNGLEGDKIALFTAG